MSKNGGSPKPDNHVIVLFGATGDLAKRKLLPGLFHLHAAGLLPKEYRTLAVITDVDKDKVYAFGKAGGLEVKKDHFYFELTEQQLPALTWFDPADLAKVQGAEPMRTALQYARFLSKQQKGADKAP